MNNCPFCSHDKLIYECRYPDYQNSIVKIYSCSNCGVFIPEYNKELYTMQEQTKLHECMWIKNTTDELTEAKDGMVDMVSKQKNIIGEPNANHFVFDVGSGRGNLTAALKQHGYNVKACEPSKLLYNQAVQNYGLTELDLQNFDAKSFLNDVSQSLSDDTTIITIYLWHVLEHIKESKSIIEYIMKLFSNKKLNIMIQMPMLKSDYIFPEHYFLATPDWIQYISEITELKLVDFSFSKKSLYISGFYSNNDELEELHLKRPFRSLSQFERYDLLCCNV